ncbi:MULTISPECIES: protease pro-enzyme activation domain-containing protein [unclassified Dyella]|uniref:protease pro-enzyme activation domain-containing protein n=1 Tax=unclassified Dyella TaxID=2634549 RepID=UPI000CB19D19|nr:MULTISPECIES: protease pro-enzyme activation domain-containing protein [unclassified Dyella]MDR3446554.1 protease pro-enzyme activation domain-containing protein [Dyella sp.]PMQ03877.1 Xanthomonalisin [Dyella sp. AD56]
MTVRIDLRGKAFRKALLPLAMSFAMAGSLHATTNDGWVGVRTQAAMTRNAAPGTAATAAVATNNSWTLSMHGSPKVDAATVSPLEASKPMHVALSLNMRNVNELETFLHAVNDPASPQFHHFLTPAQFKARFAPSDAQVAQVVAHLSQSGFSNVRVSPNNMLVEADGNANSVNAAFRTTMRTFKFGGKQRIANDAAVQVPQALGGIVDSVLGLQNLNVPHTMHHIVGPVHAGTNSVGIQATGTQTSHSPTDFPKVYDAGSTPTASNTKVGIITWGDLTQTITDLNTFTSGAGMSTVNTQVVKTGTSAYADDPNGDGEWNLDSQTITGTSGGVNTLIFYTAPNCDANDSCLTDAAITASYNRAVTDNIAKVINVSLGEDESAANSSGTQAADDKIFAQAVAQGQTFSIASGDAGVYQWSSDPTEGAPGYVANSSGTVEISLSHYSVSEPASSPNVVAVGGTTLSTSGTTWAGETVWNEGLAAVDSTNGDNNERLWATGGGVSLFESAPAWQTTALGSSVTMRQVPDLAFDAAQSTGANIVIQGQTYQIGGTSLASPIFVGIWARILSANNNTLGLPTQNMYAHFPSDASPLHDVTSGNNGYNGYGYTAKAGFDNTTGWGSLDIAKFSSYVTQYWGGTTGGGTGGTPTANFSVVTSGLTANFTDSSTDSGGSITGYSWTFGDNGTATTASPSHTYAAAGTYNVTETVTDGASGKTSSKTSSVTVSGGSTPSQIIVNPGFETGTASPWSMSSGTLCSNSTCSGETAHSGTWFAWLDGYGSTHTDTVSQKVAIPSGKTSAKLTFYLHVDTAETSTTTAYDKLSVQVLNSSGTVLKTLATYSNLNAASGYSQASFDLSAYIGQTVTLKFTGSEDASLQTSFVLDDVNLTVQ